VEAGLKVEMEVWEVKEQEAEEDGMVVRVGRAQFLLDHQEV
jgi:hypothetical protein